jgi:hypothetical protein
MGCGRRAMNVPVRGAACAGVGRTALRWRLPPTLLHAAWPRACNCSAARVVCVQAQYEKANAPRWKGLAAVSTVMRQLAAAPRWLQHRRWVMHNVRPRIECMHAPMAPVSVAPQAHLSTGHDVILLRQNVHQLALALVAPLRAEHQRNLRVQLFLGSGRRSRLHGGGCAGGRCQLPPSSQRGTPLHHRQCSHTHLALLQKPARRRGDAALQQHGLSLRSLLTPALPLPAECGPQAAPLACAIAWYEPMFHALLRIVLRAPSRAHSGATALHNAVGSAWTLVCLPICLLRH